LSRLVYSLALASLLSLCVEAAPFAASGVFFQDNQVRLFALTLSEPGGALVTIRSLGYAGGANVLATPVAAGGFASALTLFTESGDTLLLSDNTGSCPSGGTDPVSGLCLDAGLQAFLPYGNYLLALTQQDNSALGPTLADGFLHDADPNFTSGPFLDPFGNARTGAWHVDIEGVSAFTPIPEPATWLLAAPALVLFWRRKARS